MTSPPAPDKGPREYRIPEGDDRKRLTCPDCDFIHYENPKVIVGALALHYQQDMPYILLCKRAIEPRYGYWTLPAGFMELSESTQQGAAREAYEEAGVHLKMGHLFCLYEIPHISQIHMYYLAEAATQDVAPGIESLEAAYFPLTDLPTQDLAFPTIHWAIRDLQAYLRHPDTILPYYTPKNKENRLP